MSTYNFWSWVLSPHLTSIFKVGTYTTTVSFGTLTSHTPTSTPLTQNLMRCRFSNPSIPLWSFSRLFLTRHSVHLLVLPHLRVYGTLLWQRSSALTSWHSLRRVESSSYSGNFVLVSQIVVPLVTTEKVLVKVPSSKFSPKYPPLFDLSDEISRRLFTPPSISLFTQF